MKKIQLVNRDEELALLENAILEYSEQGKIISISGIAGVGKTSFFRLFKQKFEADTNEKFLCLEERVLAIDNPITFFDRFFVNLESKIHPKNHHLNNFFKNIQNQSNWELKLYQVIMECLLILMLFSQIINQIHIKR